MSKTYRMPPLAGEMKAHHHRADPPSAGFYVEGEVIWVPLALLTEVTPQPEPGYYVAVDDSDGATVLAERDGEDWYLTGQIGSVPWGAVRDNYSTFTRLIPAPVVEPVTLPWMAKPGTREVTVSRDEHPDSLPGGVFVEIADPDDGVLEIWLPQERAQDMARAINTAADAAERES